jgi:hypothetical protein
MPILVTSTCTWTAPPAFAQDAAWDNVVTSGNPEAAFCKPYLTSESVVQRKVLDIWATDGLPVFEGKPNPGDRVQQNPNTPPSMGESVPDVGIIRYPTLFKYTDHTTGPGGQPSTWTYLRRTPYDPSVLGTPLQWNLFGPQTTVIQANGMARNLDVPSYEMVASAYCHARYARIKAARDMVALENKYRDELQKLKKSHNAALCLLAKNRA